MSAAAASTTAKSAAAVSLAASAQQAMHLDSRVSVVLAAQARGATCTSSPATSAAAAAAVTHCVLTGRGRGQAVIPGPITKRAGNGRSNFEAVDTKA